MEMRNLTDFYLYIKTIFSKVNENCNEFRILLSTPYSNDPKSLT